MRDHDGPKEEFSWPLGSLSLRPPNPNLIVVRHQPHGYVFNGGVIRMAKNGQVVTGPVANLKSPHDGGR